MANSRLSRWVSRTRLLLSRTRLPYLAHDYPISHTITPSRTRLPLSRTRLPPSRTRLPPSRTRFQSRSRWVFCCKWSKIDWMSMKEETIQATNRVREAEKAHNIRTFSHGRGAKKKDPNCIQIRVLLCVCLNETIRALAFTRLYTILFYVQLLCTSIYHHIRPFYTFIHDLALPLKCIRLSQAKETYCFEWRSIVFKPCEGW